MPENSQNLLIRDGCREVPTGNLGVSFAHYPVDSKSALSARFSGIPRELSPSFENDRVIYAVKEESAHYPVDSKSALSVRFSGIPRKLFPSFENDSIGTDFG